MLGTEPGNGVSRQYPDSPQKTEHCETQQALDRERRALAAFSDAREKHLPWHGPEQKRAVRALEECWLRERRRCTEKATIAIRTYRALVDDRHEGEEARSLLCNLCWMLFSWAEERGSKIAAAYYMRLLDQYDDGRYQDIREGICTLEVESDPAFAKVWLERLDGEHPVRFLGKTPIDPTDIDPGSYRLRVEHRAHAPLWYAFVLKRCSDLQLQIRLFPSADLGANYCQISAGHFASGGDLRADGSGQQKRRFLDNYAIARHPVTVQDYQVYLNAVSRTKPAQAIRDTPHGPPRRKGDGELPITGLNHRSAEAYCEWLTERTGTIHRLPDEFEWEKAARGADGRTFPWGNRFDANWCQMRYTSEGSPDRTTIDSCPEDLSVHGMRHSAGLVSEWTRSAFAGDPSLLVIRGGSFEVGADGCRLARRHALAAKNHRNDVGFRVVRELPSGGGDRRRESAIPCLLEDKPSSRQPTHLKLLKTGDDA